MLLLEITGEVNPIGNFICDGNPHVSFVESGLISLYPTLCQLRCLVRPFQLFINSSTEMTGSLFCRVPAG